MRHLLSIEAMSGNQIREVIDLTPKIKARRGQGEPRPLEGQCWALIFSKSSTRTRVSFEVGLRELGASVMFLSAGDIQLGRGEPIADTARVLGRMVHGAVIRTFAQEDVERFAGCSGIPTINALTDQEHPCQILADLVTIEEKLGSVEDRTVCFVGDGACNVAYSWIWAAARLGFRLRIAAPPAYQPDPALITRAGGRIEVMEDPAEAVEGADVVYTDVWVSMGKEEEAAYRSAQLGRHKLDGALVAKAAPGALVMHCLPAYRGKEIDAETFEVHSRTIFDQAENRLHAQKAILSLLER